MGNNGPQTTSPGNLLEMPVPELHPMLAESEPLGAGPDAQLSPTTGDSDAR